MNTLLETDMLVTAKVHHKFAVDLQCVRHSVFKTVLLREGYREL